jgi:hypothetical protein
VWWCHIDKKWQLFKHETHRKNNSTQYISCLDEHMKARMLEIYMAMTANHFFFQKPGAFDDGIHGLCRGGAWGLGQLEDCSRQPSWQCAFIPTR